MQTARRGEGACHMSCPDLDRQRTALVETLRREGIHDVKVLEAIGRVPRHAFVPPDLAPWAYEDRPLPIGHGQTISQPFIVALSAQALQVNPGARVLEVGTGSGYQAAVLAELGARVYTIERIEDFARNTERLLRSLGYTDVAIRVGDGTRGWPEQAPFPGIVVTAAAPDIPPSLAEQLDEGGRMVIPVGPRSYQELVLVRREGGRTVQSVLCPCTFVPLLGAEGWR